MKTSFSFPLLALVAASSAALALAGCGAPQNADVASNSTDVTSNAMANQTAIEQPTATPSGPKVPEDERYRATDASDQDFGPDATPAMLKAYKDAMSKAHQPRPPLNMPLPDKVRVVLTTNRGPITLELDAKAAPLHVKSFVYLANRGFFNGTSFHRHADLLGGGKGFIIQGGDPLTKDPTAVAYAGLGGPGYTIPRERNGLTHKKLVIAAARTNDPDSAGSQFYLTQDAVPFLDQGDGYTVFGKVVGGADAAMKLTQGDTLQSVKVTGVAKTSAAQPKMDAKVNPKN